MRIGQFAFETLDWKVDITYDKGVEVNIIDKFYLKDQELVKI